MRNDELQSVLSRVRTGPAAAGAMAVLTATVDAPGRMDGLIVDALEALDGEDREGLLAVIVALGCFASAAVLEWGDATGKSPHALLDRWGLLRPA